MHCVCERETCVHKNAEIEFGKEGKINIERHKRVAIFVMYFRQVRIAPTQFSKYILHFFTAKKIQGWLHSTILKC